jgi:hypothetical protein
VAAVPDDRHSEDTLKSFKRTFNATVLTLAEGRASRRFVFAGLPTMVTYVVVMAVPALHHLVPWLP